MDCQEQAVNKIPDDLLNIVGIYGSRPLVLSKARRQLEKLCRYVALPAVATERLSVLPDGRAAYQLRHKWRNGATHVIFEPLDLIAKLAALVPPPRFNLVRYHGVLAPCSRLRNWVVPLDPGQTDTAHGCGCGEEKTSSEDSQKGDCRHPRNYRWTLT